PASKPMKPISKTTSENAQNVGATVTKKSAPFYHEVADASSTIVSKVKGRGSWD
ncbi:Hypothetical predicted protein, partial [Olea europaea subsp. europaea]